MTRSTAGAQPGESYRGRLDPRLRRVTAGVRVDPDGRCHRWVRTPVRHSVVIPLGRVE